jgi:hypothetical protein
MSMIQLCTGDTAYDIRNSREWSMGLKRVVEKWLWSVGKRKTASVGAVVSV